MSEQAAPPDASPQRVGNVRRETAMPESLRLAGQRVLVVGLARGGAAAARLAHARGARVTVTDRRAATELGPVVDDLGRSIELALGGHDPADFTRAAPIVASPGAPLALPEIQSARRQGVPVLAEVELAVRLLPPPASRWSA